MNIFIISDDTAFEQEKLFLNIVSQFKWVRIYYCPLKKNQEILWTQYNSIIFIEYNSFIEKLNNNHWAIIIYFNYYWNLDNFNFSEYKLILFGYYLFYKNKIIFLQLSEIYFFDFWKLDESKNNIINLFLWMKVNLISDINFPAAINYFWYRNSINYEYDLFIPMWWRLDFDFMYKIINTFSDLKILIGPIDILDYHSHLSLEDTYNIKNFINMLHKLKSENIFFIKTTSSLDFAKNIAVSKLILFPLLEHKYDITRISDSISLWKIIFTNKINGNKHINNLEFYNWFEDCVKRIKFALENRMYENLEKRQELIKYYDKEHSIVRLSLDLYKFILKNIKHEKTMF